MKTRITLTIDPAVSHLAKQRARAQGTSVSNLVEQMLREEIREESTPDAPTFSSRWAGKAKLAGRSDTRSKRLREKYGA